MEKTGIEVLEDGEELTHVRIFGRLDIQGVDQVDQQFSAAVGGNGKNAIINFSGVTFLASMGIRMLVESARRLKRQGAGLVIYAPNRVVRESIERCALFDLLPVAADESAARARF